MAVAYVMLELVVVPLGVLLLALTFVPGDPGLEAPGAPPANAEALHLPAVSESGTVLLMDPGQRPGRRGPSVR